MSSFTFQSGDCLGLKPFCERFERFLMVEHDYVDGSLVVALDGGFGSGKSTFLAMWEADLQLRREAGIEVPMSIHLNAWESDFCGDPLMAVLAGLTKEVDAWTTGESDNRKDRFREAAKDVGWFVTGLANEFVAKCTGLNMIAAGRVAEEMRERREEEIPDFVDLYRERIAALEKLKTLLSEFFGGDKPKVLVFVDELDRCRPDYAVSYLETIKHVFDVRGMVFVLTVDRAHLSNSAKSLFGANLDFAEYLRKFVHRSVCLPIPSEAGCRGLVNAYVDRFLEIEGKRICGIILDSNFRERTIELATGFGMRPRQLQEVFRIVGHLNAIEEPSGRGRAAWCRVHAGLLMAFLKVARQDAYAKVVAGAMDPCEFGLLLISLLDKESADWWFKIYLTGVKLSEDAESILRRLGLIAAEQPFDRHQALGLFGQGWGYLPDRIMGIVRRIENVESLVQQ